MINKQSVIAINENALIQKVSDEMVILDADSGQYYTLNELAAIILEQLKEGADVAHVLRYVCEQYEVTEEQALNDIIEVVNTLINKNIASLK